MASNRISDVPHNLEAEQAALGSTLLDRDAIARVAALIRPEDFYRDAHRRIYEAITDLFERGEPVDLVIVTDRLRDKGQLDDVGGASYVTSLLDSVPTAANVEYYARIVLEKSCLRQEISAHASAEHRLRTGENPERVASDVRAALEKIATRRARGNRISAAVGDVDLASLLSRIVTFLTRFVAFASPHQPVAGALWIAMTHVIDAFEVVGYLAITSAEKRSAKTRLLELLELLVANPWRIIRPSEAVTFRKLAADRPTLLIDEVDAIFRDKSATYEGIRALLNAGYRRGAKVPRVVGEGKAMDVKNFEVFGPKALAGIGDLPDTVADRSIPIRLARRAPHERVQPFRLRTVLPDALPLREEIAQWAAHAIPLLTDARPQLPGALNDRQSEIWEPLLSLADLAGGGWPRAARAAAVALHGDSFAQEETLGEVLLKAIYEVFEETGEDRLTTSEILHRLVERDDGPWAEWWGRQVTAGDGKGPGHRLARLLRPFAISPRKVRVTEGTLQGYYRAAFADTFARYLPSLDAKNGTTEQPAPDAAEMRSEEVSSKSETERVLPAPDAACSVVPFSSALVEGGDDLVTPEDLARAGGRGQFILRVGEGRAWRPYHFAGLNAGDKLAWLTFVRDSPPEELERTVEAMRSDPQLNGQLHDGADLIRRAVEIFDAEIVAVRDLPAGEEVGS